MLRLLTWTYDYSLRVIISYLKPYNCVQTNFYYRTETITWNQIIISIRWEYLKPYNCVKIISIRQEYLKPYYCGEIICIG